MSPQGEPPGETPAPAALPELTQPADDPVPNLGPFDKLVGLMNALGTIWIMALMLLINADIIGRAAFNRPLTGVAEIIAMSIVGIVFLQLSHTLRSGALTRSDILLGLLARHAPRLRLVLLALFHLTGAGLLALVAWKLWPALVTAFENPARHFIGNPGHFTLPRWPLLALMTLGIAATALQFAAQSLACLHAALKRGRKR